MSHVTLQITQWPNISNMLLYWYMYFKNSQSKHCIQYINCSNWTILEHENATDA